MVLVASLLLHSAQNISLLHGVGWVSYSEDLSARVTLVVLLRFLMSTSIHRRHFPPQKAGCACIFCVVEWTCYDESAFVSLIISRRYQDLEDSLLSVGTHGSYSFAGE